MEDLSQVHAVCSITASLLMKLIRLGGGDIHDTSMKISRLQAELLKREMHWSSLLHSCSFITAFGGSLTLEYISTHQVLMPHKESHTAALRVASIEQDAFAARLANLLFVSLGRSHGTTLMLT